MATNNTFGTLQTTRICRQRIIGTIKTVCVYALCSDSEVRLTTQSLRQPCCVMHAHSNTIEYKYQTCSKSIICLVLVYFNLCNNATQ